jgi:phenylacetate-coenzyme A ligase PaaK-like adenylate-forming protein
VTLQLDYPEESPLYLGLDRADLRRYADVLRRCLALLGAQPGDTVAVYDYGTSPTAYLASGAYVPYLRLGAADALGCTVVCNDGVSNMAQRAVDLLKYVRPRLLVARVDCLQPLLAACEADGVVVASHLEALVVTHNEGRLDVRLRAQCQQRLGVPVYELPRSDLALFMAVECPECRLLHTWPDRFDVELLSPDGTAPADTDQPSRLVITPRFARLWRIPRVLTGLEALPAQPGCPRAPGDLRLRHFQPT